MYNVIKFARISPLHLEMNIVLNIQSPGYYADSLNVKRQYYKLNVGTTFILFFNFFIFILCTLFTVGQLPYTWVIHTGENPCLFYCFWFFTFFYFYKCFCIFKFFIYMYKRKKIPYNRPSKGNLGLTELSNCKQPTTKCCN